MIRDRLSSQPTASVVSGNDHLELIRTRTGSTSLAHWTRNKTSYATQFQVGSQTFVAADVETGIPREMQLPREVGSLEGATAIVPNIVENLRKATGVSPENAELAALIGVATHFPDCRDSGLRVVVTGRDEWEAIQFLQSLSGFCYQALPVTNFTFEHLRRLPAGCSPTFLISDPCPSRSMMEFLTATQHSSFAVTGRDGSIFTRTFSAILLDPGLTRYGPPSSFLRIDATPQVRPKGFDSDDRKRIADQSRSQLLRYRLHSWERVRHAAFDPVELEGNARTTASVLGSCFPDDPALRTRVVELVRSQAEACKLDSASGEVAVVLDALLVLSHEGKTEVYVGEVAKIANGILDIRGDGYHLDPRRVGAVLKRFGLNRTRDRKGYRSTLTAAIKRRIHELGRSLDVPFFNGEITPCEFCLATGTSQIS